MSTTTQYLVEQLSTLIATHSLGAFVHSLRTTDNNVLHSNDNSTNNVFTTVDELDNRTLLGKAVDSVMTATSLAQDVGEEEDEDEDFVQHKQVLDDAVNVFGLVLEHSSLDNASPDDLNEMVSCIEDDQLRNMVCDWIDTAGERKQFHLPQVRLESIEQTYQAWLSEQDKVSDDEDLAEAQAQDNEQDPQAAALMSQLQAQIMNGHAVAEPSQSLEQSIAASIASLIPGQSRSSRADSEPATEGPPPAKRARRASAGDSPGEDDKPSHHSRAATVHEESGEEEDAEGEEIDEQQLSNNWVGRDIESAVTSHLQSQLFGDNQAGPSSVKAETLSFVSPLPAPGHSSRPYQQPQAPPQQQQQQRQQQQVNYQEYDEDEEDDEEDEAQDPTALLDPSRMAKAISRGVKPSIKIKQRPLQEEVSSTGQVYTPPSMKPYACTTPGCTARYKQANGLKYHRLHGKCNVRNGSMLVDEDEEDKRYVCHSAECGKRYKK
ncbi:hypothetical protein ACM66B_000533 [Microbotryomycetes sp. NB124-2]